MRFWRSLGRSIALGGMFLYAGTELLVRRPRTREARAEWLHRFCARALARLRVRVEVEGAVPNGGVVISNHLSYLDIVAFGAAVPCVFCSKAEIERWPLVGWMTTMAGTVYVERGRGGSAAKAGAGMKAASLAGLPVIFFPEGTTSNGAGLLKFHSGLLAQAMASGERITPAFVRYFLDEENGDGLTVANDVCYWGDRGMLPHLFRLLGLRGIRGVIRFADAPLRFSSEGLHRKAAAVEAQAAVERLGEAPVAPRVSLS